MAGNVDSFTQDNHSLFDIDLKAWKFILGLGIDVLFNIPNVYFSVQGAMVGWVSQEGINTIIVSRVLNQVEVLGGCMDKCVIIKV